MTTETTFSSLDAVLSHIEGQHGVEILLAVEYGSRAWGLEGPGSDHDIRLIYKEPIDKAFALFPSQDTIELGCFAMMDGEVREIQLAGWSVQKALKLAVASNPQLLEFEACPVKLVSNTSFGEALSSLTDQASLRVMAHYYRGIAKKNLLGRLLKEEKPDLKYSLQVFRGVLMAEWIHKNRSFPPISFDDLSAPFFTVAPKDLAYVVEKLVEHKRSGGHRYDGPDVSLILDYCARRINNLDVDIPQDLPETHINPEVGEAALATIYPEVFTVKDLDLTFE